MTDGGHVFVVQGLLEHLDCDVQVVPSGARFTIEPDWAAALGGRTDEALRPAGWQARGYGRSCSEADLPLPTWFVDAVWSRGQDAPEAARALAGRLAATLGEIADAAVEPQHQRPRPLVAVPALGTGGGGFDPVRGALVDLLLETCQDAVARTGIDVAVVAKHPADYSAFQEVRRRRSVRDELPGELYEAAAELAGRARDGTLALFLGAGVGVAAGLPSWPELLERLERRTGVPLADLSLLDQAELLRRELGADFGDQVAEELRGADRYALTHASLAALGCTEVVTTSYDTLYELAATDATRESVPVLPGGTVRPRHPWVLKMHGDLGRPASIVLSRSDVVSYDATSRPMASMVQALMIVRHLLVVGTSMTDDNFLRLAHEVAAFQDRDENGAGDAERGLIGTVVTLEPKPAQARLWRGRFRYLATSEGESGAEHARHLAIFLDHVAMLAAGRGSYLLDPRYEQMLSGPERGPAAAARDLAAAVAALPAESSTAWQQLREQLGALGAVTRRGTPGGG